MHHRSFSAINAGSMPYLKKGFYWRIRRKTQHVDDEHQDIVKSDVTMATDRLGNKDAAQGPEPTGAP